MASADYDKAIDHILHRLRAELSPQLTFHNFSHTQNDVLPAARKLALLSRLPEEETRLLEVAAAYHDSGYLEVCDGHEQVSIQIASTTLPRFGFSPAQVQRVICLILATQVPQCPCNLAEEILVDADLDVLGREDFFERNEALRQELANLGIEFSQRQWLEEQISFLQGHSYFTQAARDLRELGKQKHIERLRLVLTKCQ
jgi:uncharacterized protein